MKLSTTTNITAFSNRLDAEDFAFGGKDFVAETRIVRIGMAIAAVAVLLAALAVVLSGITVLGVFTAGLWFNTGAGTIYFCRKLQSEINRRRFAESIALTYIDHTSSLGAGRRSSGLVAVA